MISDEETPMRYVTLGTNSFHKKKKKEDGANFFPSISLAVSNPKYYVDFLDDLRLLHAILEIVSIWHGDNPTWRLISCKS